MTANELNDLAAHVMQTCQDAVYKVSATERPRLEDAYRLAQGVADLLGPADDEVPTIEQGLALARFLRPAFRDSVHVGLRSAFVARGGAGLPDDYLHVRLQDGYEGGIDREGRVST